MPNIKEEIVKITNGLPQGVRLVAISKFHPANAIEEAYAAGQRIFGESHVKELQQKMAVLHKDIEWHFIGHLQTNKVKYIAPFIKLIHAVDTIKLLQEIDKQAKRAGRIIPILIQLHIAEEETKFGFTIEECRNLLTTQDWSEYPNVRVSGLMCMATNTDDMEQVRREFRTVHDFFCEMKASCTNLTSFTELSMGMSHDYPIAVEEGSTLIRVGSKIFGERDYSKN
jgi:pyridoxal phosphate enzyme (YggS family)